MEKAIITMRIVFSAGLFLMALGGFLWWHGKRLKMRCTEQTPGVVVDEGRSRRISQKNEIYLPKYSYSVLGVEYTKQKGTGNTRKVSTGQSVTVFYDPANPQRSYVVELGTRSVALWAVIPAGVVCILLGLLFRFA